jgi:AAA15 family ATPase/GTPase
MLIEFSVANFRSFRDRMTLSLEAEPRISERDKTVDERNIAHTADGDLLRVVGIYGANAGGKSNLVTALATFRNLVLNSAREGQSGDRLPAAPFRLDTDSRQAPSEFEIVFTQAGVQFRYGAAFTTTRIEREWLFVRPAEADEEERWFERTQGRFETGGAWLRDSGVEQRTRPEALHISVAAAWNHTQALQLLAWFREELRVVDVLGDHDNPDSTIELLKAGAPGQPIRALIRRLDFGIDDLRLGEDEYEHVHISHHQGRVTMRSIHRLVVIRQGVEFDLASDESAGTNKAIALAGPIVATLARGGILVIDEFDARLHTLLAKQLVELFQDPATNPHDAQLVFTSHDTNLLTRTLLRRDQLWFVEKSHKTHASDLYSLAEIRLDDGKAIRNDARYESDYLQGRYGAIPFFGNLKALLGEALSPTAPKKDE